MFADINIEGFLRIETRDSTESYALRKYFDKSPANSGIILEKHGSKTTLAIPEGYPKIRKQKKVDK